MIRACLGLFLLVLFSSISTPARAAQPEKKPRRPNIVFIMADDHASAAISCYGSWLAKQHKTPSIDRLARGGMRFTNALVVNSICTPSRAAILTGKYSHKNGVYTLSDSLNPKTIHLAHLLRAVGYQTAIIGKWHLVTNPQGFDYWNILPGQGRYHDPILIGQNGKKVYKGYSTDVITDQGLDWLKRRDKDRPFLLLCHYKAPHRPWDPAPRFANLYKDVTFAEPPTLLDDYKNRARAEANTTMVIGEHMNKTDLGQQKPADLTGNALRKWAYQIYLKRYLACVAAVDENVGRILDFLDKEGLNDDTIVIYTSDQGMFLGEHGFFDKRFMLEPCLTTPLIVRYPGRIKGATVNTDMVLNIDYAPTMLDYAGVKAPDEMQGKSFRSLLEGKIPRDWRKSMYYRYWMHLAHHGVPAHYGVRTPRYTLIYYYGAPLGMKGAIDRPTAPEWELFDRRKDPEQMRNVYGDPAYAPVVRELRAELERLRKELGDTR
jgi:arylsulfatase A-like enzyme